ncbi:MAG: sigma-54-dependent Fis family transcriptional regulator [Acidobacteriaceae bacterium]|nr:sigma-54-dependent Fis family transcriptional regulator [Acidobacteriaceae bacterium]
MGSDITIIGNSVAMNRIRNLLERVAPRDTTVLITGEAGTGKEFFARAVHQRSARRDRPFVAVDCAAITNRGFQYELPRSYRKDVLEDLYEMAQDSTMFLGEVGAFSLDVQSKLLRLLQQPLFHNIAATASNPVRFIAATALDLAEEVSKGQFREDLYARLNVVTIDLPPLREHKDDIPLLADHFIHQLARHYNRHITGLSPSARAVLLRYDWPFNIRELKQALEHAVLGSEREYISPEDLPDRLL